MKRIVFFSIITLLLAFYAETRQTLPDNVDTALIQRVTYVSVDEKLPSWDYSTAEAAGSPDEARFVLRGDSRDYIGNYEFDGEMFDRINTPYGFFYYGRFIPTVKDYQGNIVGCYGLDSKYEYYPYALPTSDNGILKIDIGQKDCDIFVFG